MIIIAKQQVRIGGVGLFTVLHIEHNRFYHAIVKNNLPKNQINYIPVKSTAEAREILRNNKVGLIITGLIFEDMDGVEFIKEMSAGKYKNIPIIVMSSNDEGDIVAKLKQIGITNFVSKNASLEILKANIQKYVTRNAAFEELQSLKIAVLENNEIELNYFKKMFETNYVSHVHYYSNAESFLDSMEAYDLYIVDYKMPKLSGEYIISQLRENHPNAIIVAITATEEEDLVTQIVNAGASDYVKKPISQDLFITRIHMNIKGYHKENNVPVVVPENRGPASVKGVTDNDGVRARLYEEIKRIRRHKGKLSVAYIGIDRYAEMKVSYGIHYMQEVVKGISEVIRDNIRVTDIMGAIEDREFLLLLPSTELVGAAVIAEKIRDIVQDLDFGREELTITISGGVTELFNEDEDALIVKVNELMHQAQFKGGNRIEQSLEK